MSSSSLKKELSLSADPEKSTVLSRFFKTGKGEYGKGDVFLGISVPKQRKIAKKFSGLSLSELQELLSSKVHEHRFTALIILIEKYKKANKSEKKEIVDFYLSNTCNVNNWDLVDVSAYNILGDFLLDKEREILYSLAVSDNLWERRIAIIACFAFIKKNDFCDALKISEILLNDSHDLIHKAVGWMLREIGKRDFFAEENFLKEHYAKMPRTMLRYAIEKFPDEKKKFYMEKRIH